MKSIEIKSTKEDIINSLYKIVKIGNPYLQSSPLGIIDFLFGIGKKKLKGRIDNFVFKVSLNGLPPFDGCPYVINGHLIEKGDSILMNYEIKPIKFFFIFQIFTQGLFLFIMLGIVLTVNTTDALIFVCSIFFLYVGALSFFLYIMRRRRKKLERIFFAELSKKVLL